MFWAAAIAKFFKFDHFASDCDLYVDRTFDEIKEISGEICNVFYKFHRL